jgi:predicted acylesterase/phospholipase RssA
MEMGYRILTRDEHFQNDGKPKRILALDGGGLRGILTIGFLARMEAMLKERHKAGDGFRLCHYFDLIAGTSTGAIIAAALASGWTVDKIRTNYLELGEKVFGKSFFRQGLLRAKYDNQKLIDELKGLLGADTRMGSDDLKTGLMIVTKRLDSGSPWPLSNNPRAKYFLASPEGGVIGNGDYLLWQVVRASTAAPMYFDPESIRIVEQSGRKPVEGSFVDGGVSPFNNPAVQAFMYATMDGYKVGWPTGADKLLLVSVGTGMRDPGVKVTSITAGQGVQSLVSLMDDCAALMETLLQWISVSPTARAIDSELGSLHNDLLAPMPLVSYLRYNLELTRGAVSNLIPTLTDPEEIESLSAMDDPANMNVLEKLGRLAAEKQIADDHFAARFDLPVS